MLREKGKRNVGRLETPAHRIRTPEYAVCRCNGSARKGLQQTCDAGRSDGAGVCPYVEGVEAGSCKIVFKSNLCWPDFGPSMPGLSTWRSRSSESVLSGPSHPVTVPGDAYYGHERKSWM